MKHTLFAVLLAGVGLMGYTSVSAQNRAAAGAIPTFSKDVAPILYKSCTSCHRPGEIGPMSLLTYNDARPHARSIAAYTGQGIMPPWHADPAHGEFVNARRLTDAEKDVLARWADGGAPEGNRSDLPPAPVYPDGWNIGQPDAIFTMNESYPVSASGTIDYKHFEVPTNLTEDRWIQAYEVKPGTPSVVHHVIVYARPPRRTPPAGAAAPSGTPPAATAPGAAAPAAGAAAPAAPAAPPQAPFAFAPGMNLPPDVRKQMARGETPNDRPSPPGGLGAFVGAFAPGQGIRVYHPGTAMKLQAGTTLIFQMHYTATGTATTDRTKIGFVFAKTPPKQEAITVSLINQNFTLPAGAPNTRVDAQMTFNRDATIWSILPHTHVRGKAWTVEVTYPDGRKETVLNVPKYDFNWQTDYVFKEPLKLPKGSTLRTSAVYDNSSANKSNPDPKIDVHWGEQTWEEMQFTAMTVTLDLPATPSGGQ
jgi:hypothetical protein